MGDWLGALGISKTGILAGALKMVGVPDRAAHAIGLAAELSRGLTKDGFDLDKVNKGALARHALKAFGVDSPMANLALTAALKVMPKGFCSAALGAVGLGAAATGVGAVAMTALGALGKSQLGIASMLAGVTGMSPNAMAGTGFNFLFGNKAQEMRGLLGMQRAAGGPGSMFAALPKPAFFEDIISALMVDFVKDKQQEVEGKLKDLQSRSEQGKSAGNQAGGFFTGLARKFIPGVGRGNDAATDGNSDSRNIEFEMIKNEVQKLTQMQQAMSNVLNTMHEQAMGAIRMIKA
jgi:hypothetical protein